MRLSTTGVAITAALALIIAGSSAAAGQVSLTVIGATYSENFDTLASAGTSSTTPNGWAFSEAGTNANTTYNTGAGTNNAGDTYSFGAASTTERALGGLQSGTLIPTIGAEFTNNTGSTITSLDIAYTGEQWRLGTLNRADRLDFQLSTDATSLTTGAWTDYDALDFSAPTQGPTIGALNGNAAANRTALAASVAGLNIAPGASFWIRWTDFNASGADDGLAVDDFSLIPRTSTETLVFVNDVTVPEGNAGTTTAGFTVSLSQPAAAGGVTFDIATSDDSATAGSGDYVAKSLTAQTIPAGSSSYSFDVTVNGDTTFESDENFAVDVTNVSGATVSDGHGVGTIANDDEPPPTPIHDIQGAAHQSPLVGTVVPNVPGIVTAKRSNGYYMQDPNPDANDATSEGIFVFTSSAPSSINVGDSVKVNGQVTEFRPGGSSSTNLTTTELTSPSTTILSSGNGLPATTVVGNGGRTPPTTVIEDDATGSVETSGVFDPSADGIDFYESLEGMRLQMNNPVAVGPRSAFGEIFVAADDGANAAVRTTRGGVVISPGDFNPERIQLDDEIVLGSTPTGTNVGDHFTGPAIGILDYAFGNFELNLTAPLTRVDGGFQREVTRAPIDQEIVVGTYNVENLDPADGPAAFARHADLIVNHLRSPDVLAIEEIQDNNGATNDSVTDASVTWNMLIAAIQAAGGPTYQYRQINPVDDQDGGEPGGNIRVGFLFRTDRGLSFIDRPGGGSTTATTVIGHPSGPRLSSSPGRVDPQNSAWAASRKPLAGEFRMHGKKVFVIANHFNSKGGDDPLFGRFQPPTRSSEVQRHAQAQVVNDFVDDILEADANANVIVLGDINDFEFSETVDILEGGVLTSLMDTLPKAERYSYVFEGNSQVLDQILVSDPMLGNFPIDYDPVHVNAEFADQASDHDPQVARVDFRGRPTPR